MTSSRRRITDDWLHLIDCDAENVVKVSPFRPGADSPSKAHSSIIQPASPSTHSVRRCRLTPNSPALSDYHFAPLALADHSPVK